MEAGSTTVTAAGQTLALARGLLGAAGGGDASERYRQALAEAMRLSIRPVAQAVLAIMAGYILVQLWFRPAQVLAVWPAYAVQVLTPALLLLAMRYPRLQARPLEVFFAAESAFTTALVLQVLSPETAIAGIAGFLAVKMMATTVFVPWRARMQYASVAYDLVLYAIALTFAPHFADEPRKLHLLAVPAVGGLLSVLGTARAERLRSALLEQTAEREAAVARLQLLLDRMPVGCIISDKNLRYVYWNRAAEQIFGYRAEEVIGQSAVEVITPPHLRELSRRGFEELMQRDYAGPLRLENVTKDGRTIVCEWNATALRNPDGSFAGMLSMCHDVTAQHHEEETRRRLLAELQEIDRMRAVFVATLSHELRSPINVILGYYDLLLEGVFGPLSPPQQEVVERIGHSARQLLELVTSTLEVSRSEAGRSALHLTMVDPASLLEEIRTETLEMQNKPGVTVRWHAEPALPLVYTDAAKLKVIVKNLLSNALKYTENGSVEISVNRVDKGIAIRVADTGMGIPSEALPHIFEPFRRLHPEHQAGGAGLGLYLVRLFADLLGARVSVASEVGKGSTFTVWVPMQPPGTLLQP